jgi:hypothetical protein
VGILSAESELVLLSLFSSIVASFGVRQRPFSTIRTCAIAPLFRDRDFLFYRGGGRGGVCGVQFFKVSV